MSKPAFQTRLGKALRDLANKVDTTNHPLPDVRRKLESTAANLDLTCLSTGARGAGVQLLGSYRAALRVYHEVAGRAYVPVK